MPDVSSKVPSLAVAVLGGDERRDALSRFGAALAAEPDLAVLTQAIVETATRATGAAYGCFIERVRGDAPGGPDVWRVPSFVGAPREAFLAGGLPRPAALFDPEAETGTIVRSDDVAAEPAFEAPGGDRAVALPVRSFMAVGIESRTAGVTGALLFGHPEPRRFGDREQGFVAGFAGQATVAVDNAKLLASLQAENERHREVEAGLRRSEARFRAAIAAVQGVLWTNSADGRMEGEQQGWSALTGQTRAEYQGFGWGEAVHPDDVAPTIAAWTAAVAARRTFVFEHRVRRHDGQYRDCAIRAVPILDDVTGAVREWVGVHTDITEQRRAEARLEAAREAAEAANRAKSQFIANMSHELRTPLSAVIGYSGMVAEEIEDLGHQGLVDDVKKIEANARHLLGLINDVLDLSKIEAGRMTVEAVDFDVAAMIEDVVAAVTPLTARKNNRFVVAPSPGLGTMRSDEVKLRQCLLNLIGNAAKFTENGTVTLRASRILDEGEDWLSFSVEDSGIGMTPDQMGRLFTRFVQADESTTRQFGGTGLGLSITRAFCRKLGGDVTVDSHIGEGSTFTISLPAQLGSDEAAVAATDTAPPATRGEIILVVDDDSAARDLLGRFLEREGFAVKTACDGREGLALARRYRPKVVLLDVEMPYVNGWTMLQALRSDAELRDTPVIMISVLHERSVGFAMGANDYLVKPIDWGQLKRALDRFKGDGRGARVLVVDDEADARGWIGAMLTRDGWTTEVASNGAEALDEIDRSMPDLIILDLMMPVMDGFAFLRALRARPDAAHVHVVVLTAKEVTRAERADLEGNVDRVLRKGSLKLDELREELRRLVPHDGTP